MMETTARPAGFHEESGSEAAQPPAAPPARGIEAITRLLRSLGAGVLIAAASTFLLQHWEQGDDIQRYLGLLGLTAVLTGAGFFVGLRMRESKSARTFLAVAAGVIPAHFCILGGLVYSQLSLDGAALAVARYATWLAPSVPAALLTTIGASAALVPVALLAFLALARSQARALTVAYLGFNAAMLVPSRDAGVVAVLVAGLVAAFFALELRVLRRDLAMRTLEGVFVRAMLAAPIVLITLRSVLHYELSLFLVAVLAGSAALLMAAFAREARVPPALGTLLEPASLVPAAASCIAFTAAVHDGVGLPDQAVLPFATLPFTAIVLALSGVSRGRGVFYRRCAAWVALGGMGANLVLFEGAFAALLCLAVGIVVLAYGYSVRQKALLLGGVAGAGLALSYHLAYAIRLYAWSHWGGLAVLGIAVILGAALLERHHATIAERVRSWRERLGEWEY